ncbi:MAG TPA: MarR family transcriptional regulator [Burkholderiales bacterium]|nr:MarR family transcriptional regulator [Burkholderiales bacterium]
MSQIYDPKNFHPPSSVGALISRVRNVLFDRLDHALEPFELTTPQYVVIVLLANGIASKASDICRTVAHDPGAMTRVIDRLEERKLVRRVPDPADRRALKLELTPEGRALYPKVIAVAVGMINDLLEGFTKAEVRQMEDFMKRILENAGETVYLKTEKA